MTRCTYPDCQMPARFTVNADGYYSPMAATCAEHLGPTLERDLAAPGSTRRWIIAETT